MKNVHHKEIHDSYTEAMKKVGLLCPVKYSRKFIIMGYSRNLYIPNFGGEHPGSTYYFSPNHVYYLVLLNVPHVVTLYIIMYISRLMVRK